MDPTIHNDDRDGGLPEGLGRWVGRALVLAVVALALLRGWHGLALVAVCAAAGPYLGAVLSRAFRGRRKLLAVAVALGVAGAAVAVPGVAGLFSFATLGSVGLWAPLAALLLTAVPKPVLERERLKDADKLRMMLDLYPHPEGGRWTPERMGEATDDALDARTFRDLSEGRGDAVGSLGLSLDEAAAMARAMDFPLELWYRKIEWWEALHERWRRGEDVSERLQEWDCVTPERAAERLAVSAEDVMEMVAVGQLEAREDREGGWQIREDPVFREEMERAGKDASVLPPVPRSAKPGRTGSGNHLDRRGKPL